MITNHINVKAQSLSALYMVLAVLKEKMNDQLGFRG